MQFTTDQWKRVFQHHIARSFPPGPAGTKQITNLYRQYNIPEEPPDWPMSILSRRNTKFVESVFTAVPTRKHMTVGNILLPRFRIHPDCVNARLFATNYSLRLFSAVQPDMSYLGRGVPASSLAAARNRLASGWPGQSRNPSSNCSIASAYRPCFARQSPRLILSSAVP